MVLAGARRAHHHVPGQHVERVLPALAAAQLGGLEGGDALLELPVDLLDLGDALRLGRERLLLGLLGDRLLQRAGGAGGADAPEDDDADHHQHHHRGNDGEGQSQGMPSPIPRKNHPAHARTMIRALRIHSHIERLPCAATWWPRRAS